MTTGHTERGQTTAPKHTRRAGRARSSGSGAPHDPAPSDDGDRAAAEPAHARFLKSFKIDDNCRYLLNNQTAYLIHIRHEDPEIGDLMLPPFAERVIKGARLQPFERLIRPHRQRHEIFVRKYREQVSFFARLIWFAWFALVGLFGIAIFDLLTVGSLARIEFIVAAGATAAIFAIVLIGAAADETKRRRKAAHEGAEAGDIAFGVGSSYTDGNETARSAQRLLTLGLVLTVGAVLPTLGIIMATDAKDFLVLDGGLRVKPDIESRLVSRLIQIVYTSVLSLFPAMLFFQFDRQRAGSVRGEWVRALFRMDGRMRTLADVHATYGNAMYEASSNTDDSVRGLGGKHSPIVIATILIALGWTVLVVRTESYDFSGATTASQQVEIAEEQAAIAERAATAANSSTSSEEATAAALNAGGAAVAASSAQQAVAEVAGASKSADTPASDDSGDPVNGDDPNGSTGAADVVDVVDPPAMAIDDARAAADAASVEAGQAALAANADATQIQGTSFFQVLAPNPSAAGMAFLGAYFFGIYLVLRSYFRGDLRSKLYNQITARLLTVVVIAYLINALMFRNNDQQEVVWALAFLAGVVPTTVLDRMFKALGGLAQAVAGDVFSSDRPLEHIDGIDIYDSSRLESEGIPDVASLATSDLAAVMLQTRLPIGRLIDWADQAALMVVVGVPGPNLDPRVRCLRTRGIRTGTDLLAVAEIDGNIDEIVGCLQLPPHPKLQGWWQRRGEKKAARAMGEQRTGPDGGVAAAMQATPTNPHASADGSHGGPSEHVAIGNDVNVIDLCQAIRRQPVMSQILQWRSSALDDVDRRWIPLPDIDAPPQPSESYEGPLPTRLRKSNDGSGSAPPAVAVG